MKKMKITEKNMFSIADKINKWLSKSSVCLDGELREKYCYNEQGLTILDEDKKPLVCQYMYFSPLYNAICKKHWQYNRSNQLYSSRLATKIPNIKVLLLVNGQFSLKGIPLHENDFVSFGKDNMIFYLQELVLDIGKDGHTNAHVIVKKVMLIRHEIDEKDLNIQKVESLIAPVNDIYYGERDNSSVEEPDFHDKFEFASELIRNLYANAECACANNQNIFSGKMDYLCCDNKTINLFYEANIEKSMVEFWSANYPEKQKDYFQIFFAETADSDEYKVLFEDEDSYFMDSDDCWD